MITDIFAKRFEDVKYGREWAENIISPTVVQASRIFFDDVQTILKFPDEFFERIRACTHKIATDWRSLGRSA